MNNTAIIGKKIGAREKPLNTRIESMLRKTLFSVFVILMYLGILIGLSFTIFQHTLFFYDPIILVSIPVAIGIGFVAGAIFGAQKKKDRIISGEITRHGIHTIISHWGTAFGIFALMASGILSGFLNVPPFFSTPSMLMMALNIHFFAILLISLTGTFFIADYTFSRQWLLLWPTMTDIIHGFFDNLILHHPWAKERKYLSSQKVAFLGAAVIGLVMLVTGAIKVASHVYIINANVWAWATVIHDVFFLLMVLYLIVHVGMVLLGGHWASFESYFTGEMSAKLAAKDYPLWYEEVKSGGNKKEA